MLRGKLAHACLREPGQLHSLESTLSVAMYQHQEQPQHTVGACATSLEVLEGPVNLPYVITV